MSSSDIPRQFTYGRAKTKIFFAFVLGAWLLGFILWPAWTTERDWAEFEMFFSIPGFFFLLILFVNFFLTTSDIEIDSDGIRWIIFGRAWREISWDNVNHLRISSVWDFEHKRIKKIYSIRRTRYSRIYFLPGGSIFFDENIHDILVLKNTLWTESQKRGISVVGSDNYGEREPNSR